MTNLEELRTAKIALNAADHAYEAAGAAVVHAKQLQLAARDAYAVAREAYQKQLSQFEEELGRGGGSSMQFEIKSLSADDDTRIKEALEKAMAITPEYEKNV